MPPATDVAPEPGSVGLPRKVLACIDGSDISLRAGSYALQLGDQVGAEVVALHVILLPPHAPIEAAERIREEAEPRMNEAMEGLFKEADRRGVHFTIYSRETDTSVVRAVVEFAQEEGIDLVILGTQGTSGIPKMMLGSVAAGVVAAAPCSVLAVR
ncbi:MAG: universal stress protein [Thermoplasmata archaeon]